MPFEYVGRAIIYGGRGALGSKCVAHFGEAKWWVMSIDMSENHQAHSNIVIAKEDTLEEQEITILDALQDCLGTNKVDAIFCVAGGWVGGNAATDLCKNMDLMWRQSVWSSSIAAAAASRFLTEEGILCLTGAHAALSPNPSNIGYGMAKAAVHQMVRSLSAPDSGMPSCVTAILPVTLDTPMNRRFMPDADHGSWTSLEYICELFLDWALRRKRPQSGKLCTLVTRNNVTTLTQV